MRKREIEETKNILLNFWIRIIIIIDLFFQIIFFVVVVIFVASFQSFEFEHLQMLRGKEKENSTQSGLKKYQVRKCIKGIFKNEDKMEK